MPTEINDFHFCRSDGRGTSAGYSPARHLRRAREEQSWWSWIMGSQLQDKDGCNLTFTDLNDKDYNVATTYTIEGDSNQSGLYSALAVEKSTFPDYMPQLHYEIVHDGKPMFMHKTGGRISDDGDEMRLSATIREAHVSFPRMTATPDLEGDRQKTLHVDLRYPTKQRCTKDFMSRYGTTNLDTFDRFLTRCRTTPTRELISPAAMIKE